MAKVVFLAVWGQHQMRSVLCVREPLTACSVSLTRMGLNALQVKVPEDGLGWEWLDAGAPTEAGKYKAAVSLTRSSQNEADVP